MIRKQTLYKLSFIAACLKHSWHLTDRVYPWYTSALLKVTMKSFFFFSGVLHDIVNTLCHIPDKGLLPETLIKCFNKYIIWTTTHCSKFNFYYVLPYGIEHSQLQLWLTVNNVISTCSCYLSRLSTLRLSQSTDQLWNGFGLRHQGMYCIFYIFLGL